MGGEVNGNLFVNIGGVSFQSAAVKKDPVYGKPTYYPELRVNNDNKVQKMYYVQLVDGTDVCYPEQKEGNNRYIGFSTHGDYQNPKKVIFNKIEGLEISDTEKSDNYELRFCDNATVNAKRDSVTTHGYMSGPGIAYHEYDITHSVDRDKIKVIGGGNVNVEYTSGFDILEIKTNEEIENNHTKLMEKAKDLLSE